MVRCQVANPAGDRSAGLSVAVDWRVRQECGIMDHDTMKPAPIGRVGWSRNWALHSRWD
jgi:hypothetical protein